MDDEGFGGILAPNDPKRGYWQDLFGLSSGDNKPLEKPKAKEPEKKTTSFSNKPNAATVRAASSAVIYGSSQVSGAPKEWNELVEKLAKASSTKEAIYILSYMKRNFSTRYRDALKVARGLSKGRPSTNPSGLLRSAPSRRKPF
jgi:hypothetical protein